MSRGRAAAATIGLALELTVGWALAACGSKQEAGEAAPGSPDSPDSAERAGAGAPARGAPAVAATAVAVAAPAAAPAGARVVRLEGFRTPRSVLHNPEADVYLVSNVHGNPAAADDDDNGFISRVSPDGTLLARKWIDGERDDVQLSAPMGMAIAGGLLWVADRNRVRTFDAKTGAPRKSYEIHGARTLADVVVFDGAVLVSDSGPESAPGAIFRISPRSGRVSRYLRHHDPDPADHADPYDPAGAGHPHGLAATADGWLWVTSDREVYQVRRGKRRGYAELPADALDGIVALPGGELLVASLDGIIFRGTPAPGARGRGALLPIAWTEAFTGLTTPSDLGFDARRSRVLIPLILENAVELRDLPRP